jgi:hypothetical protein
MDVTRSQVMFPPPEGWPSINTDPATLKDLSKSDDEVSQEGAHWRYSASGYPLSLQVFKGEFRALNWNPINPYTVWGG